MREVLEIILLALATARITIAITRDDIAEPMRHILFLWSPPENNDRLGWFYLNREKVNGKWRWATSPMRKPGFLGQLMSCPDCTGAWIGLIITLCYYLWHDATLIACLPFALSLAPAFLARRGWG